MIPWRRGGESRKALDPGQLAEFLHAKLARLPLICLSKMERDKRPWQAAGKDVGLPDFGVNTLRTVSSLDRERGEHA
jgi:hypothetical protein